MEIFITGVGSQRGWQLRTFSNSPICSTGSNAHSQVLAPETMLLPTPLYFRETAPNTQMWVLMFMLVLHHSILWPKLLGTCWPNPLDPVLYVWLHVALGPTRTWMMTFCIFKPAAKQEETTSFWPYKKYIWIGIFISQNIFIHLFSTEPCHPNSME